jgi:two-component system KDP operon response regulator KdpE
MDGKRLLVIDDSREVLALLEAMFSEEGAEVHVAASGEQGLRAFYSHRPHLVLLDLMMPVTDGWQVLRQIRQLSDVPVILLTARDGVDDVVQGLDLGAVDYVTKPFIPKVLLARARTALRQAECASVDVLMPYSDGYLTLDLETQQVQVASKRVNLTPTEYRLLAYLFQHADRVLSLDQILEHVWGWEYGDSPNYVHVYIRRLRQKLEKEPGNPAYLVTQRGVGYCFEKQHPDRNHRAS